MSTKDHYDNHLAAFYTWMVGDVEKLANDFKNVCLEHQIIPRKNAVALDLGAGNGIQSIALEQLGFKVTAIDFNEHLLNELKTKTNTVITQLDDIRNIKNYKQTPELVVCCGDTITHLETVDEVQSLIQNIFEILSDDGFLLLTFRDYSMELDDTNRFIPVKSDEKRVFTCFLEYMKDKVRVTDLLYEKDNIDEHWIQKISSYFKVRLSQKLVEKQLLNCGFSILFNELQRGVVTLIAKKSPPTSGK